MLEEFLWKKYGNTEILTFPMWETNTKLRLCSHVIDWMNTSNEFGYIISPEDVAVLINFLNYAKSLKPMNKAKSN